MFSLLCALFMAAGPPGRGPSFAALSRSAGEARDAQRLDEALVLFRKALAIRPGWQEGWWNLGSIAYDQNKYAECAPAFHRLAALDSKSMPAWTMAGLCEYGAHDYDAALKSLHQVQLLGFQGPPELANSARLHLALLNTKAGHFELALVTLTELTRADKKSQEISVAAGIAGLRKHWLPAEVPEASRNLVWKLGEAMTAAMERNPQAATGQFEALVRDYPKEADIHFRYGAFLSLDFPDRGLEEIRKAVELDPENVPALVNLAMLDIKRGNPEAGRPYAERAVKASPGDYATHLALGRVLLDTGAAAAALGELQLAVKLAPESTEARFSLASVYGKLGHKEEAARERAEFMRLRNLINSTK